MATKRANTYAVKDWFKVLQTTKRSQTAMMKLGPGKSTGDEAKSHKDSEQVLLLIDGELSAELAGSVRA